LTSSSAPAGWKASRAHSSIFWMRHWWWALGMGVWVSFGWGGDVHLQCKDDEGGGCVQGGRCAL
jgi:hypothetical protein